MGRINYTNQEIINMIQGTVADRNQALRWVCAEDKWQLSAKKKILECGVPLHDLEDVIQDSLTAFTFNILKKKFSGNSNLSTYYVGICRNTALKKIRNSSNYSSEDELLKLQADHYNQLEELEDEDQLKGLVSSLFSKIKEGCQKILRLYAAGLSMVDISEEMGFQNVQSAKNQTKRCRDKVKSLISADPELFNQLRRWI